MRPYRYFADVSSNNGHAELAEYAYHGGTIIAIKATQGQDYLNPLYPHWVNEAHNNGLTVVHYHFCTPEQFGPNNSEAQFFWRHVRPYWRPGDYLAYDIETSGALSWPQLNDYYSARVEQLHNISGHDPLTYGPRVFLTGMGAPAGGLGRRCWLADWVNGWSPVPEGYTRWAQQCSNGVAGPRPHQLAGIGVCDVSILPVRRALVLKARTVRRRRRLNGKAGK